MLKWLSSFTLFFILAGCAGGTSNCSTDDCGLCEQQRVGVKICQAIWSPTVDESVTLMNYNTTSVNLNGWSLWDRNAWSMGSGQKTFSISDTIMPNTMQTYTLLPFQLNDADEIIYLKDNAGTQQDVREIN